MRDASFINTMENDGTTLNIPAAHPVLVVVVGTTMIELPLVLTSELGGLGNVVPWRCICVDSMSYEDVVTRLTQNGWTAQQIREVFPRSHFFSLPNPFTEKFDFDHPLHRDWESTVFDPGLRRIAQRPDGPGCAGTPALGRARVEGSEQELFEFFNAHIRELTQLRTQTLALRQGIKAFAVTTYRGGTGTGATLPVMTVLKKLVHSGSIHLHAVMPDAYRVDMRAMANAFAATVENQGYHQYGQGVPMKGSRKFTPPLDSATYIFGSNGAVALDSRDLLMQEAAILLAYLKASTQSAIDTRFVDLTDVMPYDLEDRPMHVRVETAVSIRTMHPGIQDYLVCEWVFQELEEVLERFETWCTQKELSPEEELLVNQVFNALLGEGHLSINSLLARLDPSPQPPNELRDFFESVNTTIGSMKAAKIRENMANLPVLVRDAFTRYEESWRRGSFGLAKKLPGEITSLVMSRLAAVKHLALSTLTKIRLYLVENVNGLKREAEAARENRDKAGIQLGYALKEVQEARGFLSIIKSDEVTRDAAQKACGIAMTAALARVEQQRREFLIQVLDTGISNSGGLGKLDPVPSVKASLQDIEITKIAEIREEYTSRIAELRTRLDELGQGIEKRSQIFQRSLVYDGMNREGLKQLIRDFRRQIPQAPPIMKLLGGKQDLDRTLSELRPLLPSYADSCLSLIDILQRDSEKQKLVYQLLRSIKPFTPIDRVVEEQQNLRNRRDAMVILELPGGQDGPLFDLVLREGIVAGRNQVVDSDTDEIRMYYLRDGLPYGVIAPLLDVYKRSHDQYLETPSAITPYTHASAHVLPPLEPPKVNLKLHAERLLYAAKAVLPQRLCLKPSGGFTLCYEKETGYGFSTTSEEQFADFDSLVRWVAKRPQIRKVLESELRSCLDNDPSAYKAVLIRAWQQTDGEEKACLQEVLFSLRVDPSKPLLEVSRKNTKTRHYKTKTEEKRIRRAK